MITFWNSHGVTKNTDPDGIEIRRLEHSIADYIRSGLINLYLLWPNKLINNAMGYCIELD